MAAMKRTSSASAHSETPMKRARTGATQASPVKSLMATGQNKPSSGLCISTLLSGEPCPGKIAENDFVPYCASCRKTSDPSVKVTDHPKFGKILVAARDLPAGYRMAWWGTRTTKKEIPEAHMEWALDTPVGLIDARPHQGGSFLQFSACPGPNELTTVWMGPNTDLLMKKAPKTCMLFSTRMPVPKNHHLAMMYNESVKTTDEFFAERGLVRGDVGTTKFPALRKKNAPAL